MRPRVHATNQRPHPLGPERADTRRREEIFPPANHLSGKGGPHNLGPKERQGLARLLMGVPCCPRHPDLGRAGQGKSHRIVTDRHLPDWMQKKTAPDPMRQGRDILVIPGEGGDTVLQVTQLKIHRGPRSLHGTPGPSTHLANTVLPDLSLKLPNTIDLLIIVERLVIIEAGGRA